MKKLFVLLILLSLSNLAEASSYNTCKTYYDDGKYETAANCFAERVKTNPNDRQSSIWYAASLYFDKQYAKSYQQYKNIAQKYPNTPAGDYAKKEAQKVYNKINDVNLKRSNDSGNYISKLDYTSKWTKMPIRVWIADSKYSNSVKKAFTLWQTKTGNAISFTFVPTQSTANIKVYFVDRLSSPIMDNQLASTNLKFSNKKNYSADIKLLQRTKSNQLCSDKQIYYSALHEIGHALGISGHSDNNNDIMYYNTNTNSLGLSNRDINTIKAIYSER